MVDVTDEKMSESIGGKTLDHGGVGFHWGFDATGGVVAQGRVVVNPDGSGGESGTASGTPGPVEKPNRRLIAAMATSPWVVP